MPNHTSRHRARVGATILLAALAAGGCTHTAKGGGATTNGAAKGAAAGGAKAVGAEANSGPPNGLETKTPAAVQRAAAATLKNAKSVHVTVTGPNQPLRLDLRIQGNASTGTIGTGGTTFQVTSIGADTWIKGDPRTLRALGIPAASAQRVAGHWFKAPWRQSSGLAGFSLDSLAGSVGKNDTPLKPKVETATLDGRKVLVLSQRNGAKLFVAATGAAFPLRTDEKAGRVLFSEYGVDFHITAPVDVVDLAAAG